MRVKTRETTLLERFTDMVSDWDNYHHDLVKTQEASRITLDFSYDADSFAKNELKLASYSAQVILATIIKEELANVYTIIDLYGSINETIRKTVSRMFDEYNDKYLDAIIDFNLISDAMTKSEMQGAIEVYRTFISDANQADIYGNE